MIQVTNLSKYYAGFAAVEGVDFSIAQGEIVGLLGLNGAGKSTILKILGCFLQPSVGEVKIGGFDAEESPDEIRKAIRKNIFDNKILKCLFQLKCIITSITFDSISLKSLFKSTLTYQIYAFLQSIR